jgi:hypothetical protein
MADASSLENLTPADRNFLEAGKKLFTNPDLRLEAQRLYKKADPNAHFPELAQLDRIDQVEKAAKEREQKLEGDLIRERVERRQESRRNQMREKGYDPERIEKIIVDYNLSAAEPEKAYDYAMKIADGEARSAEPTAADIQAGPKPVDMRPAKDLRNMTPQQLKNWGSTQASEMINGFRKQGGRR